MRAGGNLPSIPWTERERAEFKRRLAALEAGVFDPVLNAPDPVQNGEVVFRRVNNTTLRIILRGTDGVVRGVDLTLT